VTEMILCCFSVELDNVHCGSLLPVADKTLDV
jgi:hypothetical protein